MSRKLNKEFNQMSVQELLSKVEELRRELFSLRLHSATTPVTDKMQFKKLRKNIARALTHLNQKLTLSI